MVRHIFHIRKMNGNQATYSLKNVLSFICCVFLFSCDPNNDEDYKPCLTPFRLEAFWPANVSFEWIPYHQNIYYTFKHSSTDSLQFQLSQFREPQDFLQSNFFVICPQDSHQMKPVDYILKSYRFTLKNTNPSQELSKIQLQLATLLDERNSSYDKVLLADILTISATLKTDGDFPLLQFPVLDRGFIPHNNIRFLYQDSLYLDQKLLYSVYYNDENPFQIQIFYTNSGIEAIRFKNKFYFRNY
ncbi:MAG: hypothetical protein IPM92_02215 [Saprospiraceae bacterium]|nr:hypothetical protein [Saprospiraceae bacterium]